MPKRPFLSVLLLLAAAPGAIADDAPEWKVPAVTKTAVDLPVVPRAEPDTPLPPAERFVVTLGPDGAIAGGTSAELAATGEPSVEGQLALDDPQSTSRALQELGLGLREATRDAGGRTADGASRVALFLRADRRAPWIHALRLLDAAVANAAGVRKILFAVQPAKAPSGDHRLALAFPSGRGSSGARVRDVFLRLELDGAPTEVGWTKRLVLLQLSDAAGTTVRRTLGSWEPRAEEPFDLAAFGKALADVQAPAPAGPLLSTTVSLTESGTFVVTVGDVLPLLAVLQERGASISLAPPPAVHGPQAPEAMVRGPFGPEKVRSTRREERWREAVAAALRWLAVHQSPSGAWEAAGFARWAHGREAGEARPDGAGKPEFDVGVTGLALMAFLGAGYGDRRKHVFEDDIRRGLDWLVGAQDPEGCYGPRESQHWIYNHGAATWAMVEAYGMSGDRRYRASAQRALDFIAMCRNPYFAWRYGVKPGDNDTSVTGWMLMPLALARVVNENAVAHDMAAPFVVDTDAFDGAHAWLDKMTDPDYGRVGYIQRGGSSARPQELIDRYPGDKSEAMTALGTTLRVYMGMDPTRNLIMKKGLGLLQRLPPVWNPIDGSIDMYYWYWGAMATWQAGGRVWKAWGEALDLAVVDSQRRDSTEALYRGSWDPIGPWGRDGGRVYSTALLALCLETPTRYARRFGH